VTGGADADADGIDDEAAAGGAGDPDDGTADPDDGTDPDDGGVVDGGDGTLPVDGQLNDITIGDAGLGVLIFDGSTLTGTVEINEGIEATGASINTGIPAAGTGEQAVALNGSSPTFFVPTGLAPDQAGLILDNIQSGNLFLQVGRRRRW